MSPPQSRREQLEHAAGLPAILDAACDAFEGMLAGLRAGEDAADGWFAAFVLAAAEAADGRDALLFAPSLPPARSTGWPGADQTLTGPESGAIAAAAAGLSRVLAVRLRAAGRSAASPGDRDACLAAARSAGEISRLLGGGGP
ncbi:MAG: hypothetical protein ACLQDY_26800 [Streptosporangiaceae bacterium]